MCRSLHLLLFTLILILSPHLAPGAMAQSRTALVIGNSAYAGAPLATPQADAKAIAETLRAAGFDLAEAYDVKRDDIGAVLRAFLDKAATAGQNGVAFFYFAGRVAQFGGENYLVPVDAQIVAAGDIPAQTLRLQELLDELGKLPIAARIISLDGSRADPAASAAEAPTPGLALLDAPSGMLISFAAGPNALSLESSGDNSVYTSFLVTQMRQPGLTLSQVFKTTRLEVYAATAGKQSPWTSDGLTVDVTLFPAPAAADQKAALAAVNEAPPPPDTKSAIAALSPDDAYHAALRADRLKTYQWFVQSFPTSPHAAEIWAIINARRESLLWQRSRVSNSARGYWNYVSRYPKGPHAQEATYDLGLLNQPPAPPPDYMPAPVDLPPDYSDDASGVPDIFQSRIDTILPVFDNSTPPDFVAPPPEPPEIVAPPPRVVILPPTPPVVVVPPPIKTKILPPNVTRPKPPRFNPPTVIDQKQRPVIPKRTPGPSLSTPNVSPVQPPHVLTSPQSGPAVVPAPAPQNPGTIQPPHIPPLPQPGPGLTRTPGPTHGSPVQPPPNPPAFHSGPLPSTPNPGLPPSHQPSPTFRPPVALPPRTVRPVQPVVHHAPPPVFRPAPPRPHPVVRQAPRHAPVFHPASPRPHPVVRQAPRHAPVFRPAPPRPHPVVRQAPRHAPVVHQAPPRRVVLPPRPAPVFRAPPRPAPAPRCPPGRRC